MVKFVKSASQWQQLPPGNKPQVAVVGRSNSGKSSFINALAKSKVAKVGQKPGKTRLLNIFDVDNKFHLVDMPGYGYAARSKSERKDWEKMIEGYLLNSEQLVGLVLLMDIRRKWSEEEWVIREFCASQNLPFILGLTKADKLSRSRWMAAQMAFEKETNIPSYALSSVKNWGIKEMMSHIYKAWL